MIKATTAQIAKIHVLLQKAGLMENKKDLVAHYSQGRTESTKELSLQEAKKFIQFLSQFDPLDDLRSAVFAMAYDAGIIWGDTLEDKKMNQVKLNQFLISKGTVKKELGKMNHAELTKTIRQFKQMLSNMEEREAAKAVSRLLEEINNEYTSSLPVGLPGKSRK